jgi:hypothetical protein
MLIGLAFFFWDIKSGKEIVSRLRFIINMRYAPVFVILMFLFVLPQLFYFNYLNGGFFKFTYGSGFTNWNHPLFAEVWFSPLNGLFLFNPVLLFFMAGLGIMLWQGIENGRLIAFMFLSVSYMAAAYSYWYYGCSSGHRAFVEFYPLLAIPLGFFIEKIASLRNLFLRTIIWLSLSATAYFSLRMNVAIISHDVERCFTGSTWDWDHYICNLDKAGLYKPVHLPESFINDFENGEIFHGNIITYDHFHSRGRSMIFDTTKTVDCQYSKKISEFKEFTPSLARASLWCMLPDTARPSALLVCSIEKNGKSIFWQSEPMIKSFVMQQTWFRVQRNFKIPHIADGEAIIHFYVWNLSGKPFYLDDLEIHFEQARPD